MWGALTNHGLRSGVYLRHSSTPRLNFSLILSVLPSLPLLKTLLSRGGVAPQRALRRAGQPLASPPLLLLLFVLLMSLRSPP